MRERGPDYDRIPEHFAICYKHEIEYHLRF